jgi:hypothetical protein
MLAVCVAGSAPGGLQHGLDRFCQDQQIQPDAAVAQVVEVVAELQFIILHAGAVGHVHLRPTAQARADPVPQPVVGDALLQFPFQLRPLRLISPRSTFSSWGSSSRRVRRSHTPTGVMR